MVIFLFLDFDWSLSNDFIVSASLDGTARVWNTSSGQNIRVLPDTYGTPVLSCHFMPLNNNMIVVSFCIIYHKSSNKHPGGTYLFFGFSIGLVRGKDVFEGGL